MNELLRQKLEENGADVEGTLHRFMGNGGLYLKFLKKLNADQSFANLKASLDQENFGEAFKAAHTLKGVSANLGLTPICNAASALTELLRGKEAASEVDMEEVAVQRSLLEESYQIFVKLIEENS